MKKIDEIVERHWNSIYEDCIPDYLADCAQNEIKYRIRQAIAEAITAIKQEHPLMRLNDKGEAVLVECENCAGLKAENEHLKKINGWSEQFMEQYPEIAREFEAFCLNDAADKKE